MIKIANQLNAFMVNCGMQHAIVERAMDGTPPTATEVGELRSFIDSWAAQNKATLGMLSMLMEDVDTLDKEAAPLRPKETPLVVVDPIKVDEAAEDAASGVPDPGGSTAVGGGG